MPTDQLPVTIGADTTGLASALQPLVDHGFLPPPGWPFSYIHDTSASRLFLGDQITAALDAGNEVLVCADPGSATADELMHGAIQARFDIVAVRANRWGEGDTGGAPAECRFANGGRVLRRSILERQARARLGIGAVGLHPQLVIVCGEFASRIGTAFWRELPEILRKDGQVFITARTVPRRPA